MDHAYYWEHDKEYKRLTFDQLDDAAAMNLACAILEGIHEDMEDILKRIGTYSYSAAYRDAKSMEFRLRSEYINGLTMGHSIDIWKDFVEKCKRRTLGRYDNPRKNDRVPDDS